MNIRLQDILKCNRSQDDCTYTHVSFFGPQGKWNIRNNEISRFWIEYCKLVSENAPKLCLAERPTENMPIIVRGSLKFHDEIENCLDQFLMDIISSFQEVIIDIFEIEKTTELSCCLLESTYSIDGYFTKGFILHFPYCRIDVRTQNDMIRPRVIKKLRSDNIMSKLPQQPINDWENIFNINGITEPYPLYGSIDSPNNPKYKLTHIYGLIQHQEDVEIELKEIFYPTYHLHVQQGSMSSTIFSSKELQYWLPLFLSVNYWTKLSKLKEDIDTSMSSFELMNSNSSMMGVNSNGIDGYSDDETDITICHQLLPMLSRERVDNDNYWIDIGKCIYNIYNGSADGLNVWIEFTEQSDNHMSDECTQLYYKFDEKNYLTLKTIAWYASIDSPILYEQWHTRWYQNSLEKATSSSHYDVARAFYRVYWLNFTCASIKDRKWYHFINDRWNVIDRGVEIKKMLSEQFRCRFERLRTDFSKRGADSDNAKDKAFYEKKIEEVIVLTEKLKNVTFKENIMKELMDHFYDPKFSINVDNNPRLTGLPNGVIEVTNTRAVFRQGKPEDFVVKSTNTVWPYDYTWEHPKVQGCMKWFCQVFIEEDLREYFLKLSASCLIGINMDKLFIIMSGEGNNSKSMIKKLYQSVLGPYCVDFPTTVLTGRRGSSSGPSPELAQAKGAKLAVLQEPENDDSILGGRLKEYTGGDTFYARLLNENGGKIEAGFKLFLMCNKPPIIPNSDTAIQNRIRILPFLSTWSDDAPDNEEEQMKQRKFKRDRLFDNKIGEFSSAFLWIMVQYYSKYISEGLREPKTISNYTLEYFRDNDPYKQFIDEMLEKVMIKDTNTLDSKVSLPLNDLVREFNFWFKDNFPNIKVQPKATLKHEFTTRLGKISSKGWAGIRIKQQNYDNVSSNL